MHVTAQILGQRHCAFVTFAERSAAERAAEEMAHKLIVRGQRCKLMWGKPQAERRPAMDPMMPSLLPPGAPGMPPPSMLPPQVRATSACAAAKDPERGVYYDGQHCAVQSMSVLREC